MTSKHPISLRVPRKDAEARVRGLEAQVRSQEVQIAQLRRAK